MHIYVHYILNTFLYNKVSSFIIIKMTYSKPKMDTK